MDDPAHGAAPPRYEPPPPFAPPVLRTAPLNEVQVLGGSSYPYEAAPAYYPPPDGCPSGGYPPVPWPGHRRAARTRRRTVAVAGAVVAALVAVAGALLIGRHAPGGRSLSLPESAGGYTRISVVPGSRLESMFGSAGTFGALPAGDLRNAKVAVYGHGPQSVPSMVFVGFTSTDSPTIGRQLRTEDSGQVTSDVLAGAGSSLAPLDVDAGPLGGSLKCGTLDLDGAGATVGVWADSDTLGMVLLFDPVLGPSREQTGALTRTFRGAAEH